MCTVLAAVGVGVAQAAMGTVGAVAQYQSQAATVARSNAIARQQYQQQLQIAQAQDEASKRTYEAQLKASEVAKNAYYRQLDANNAEYNRANIALQQKDNETRKAALFDNQAAIAAAIKAQGQVLSTGRTGQSFLLEAQEQDRVLGFEMAQIKETLYDASLASGIAQQGLLLDRQAANNSAFNNLPPDPTAPMGAFRPIAPMDAPGPSGLALAANIGSSVISGVQTSAGLVGEEWDG